MDVHELIRHIHNLPYAERRKLIADIASYNRFMYKYRSLDSSDATSIDRIRDVVVRSRLWLSSPVDFNDPFDMSGKIVVASTAAERLNRFKTALKERGVSYKERERKARELARQPVDEVERRIEASFQKQKTETGIYSFASFPRNILMWSHYSQNHTGICLQFEIARDFSTFGEAVAVEYSRDYPIISYIIGFNDGLTSILLRKHEGWSYEGERRIIKPGRARSYISFDPQAITGIIIGCKTTKSGFDTIKQLMVERRNANLPDVAIYFAHQHSTQYRLPIFKQVRNDLI